jgi:S-adenosyl methyltransferase
MPASSTRCGSRAFLEQVVEFLAAEGIRQFLDIGTGLPSANNTHEVALRGRPPTSTLTCARPVKPPTPPGRAALSSSAHGTR